jgi:hypothetical protein
MVGTLRFAHPTKSDLLLGQMRGVGERRDMHAPLSDLRGAGLVELLAGDGYRLTPLGRDMMESLLPLHHFAERWSRQTAS